MNSTSKKKKQAKVSVQNMEFSDSDADKNSSKGDDSDGMKSDSSQLTSAIDLSKIFQPVFRCEDASGLLLKSRKNIKPLTMNKTKSNKSTPPVCITLESSSDEDDKESKKSSPGYKPLESEDSDDDVKIDSDEDTKKDSDEDTKGESDEDFKNDTDDDDKSNSDDDMKDSDSPIEANSFKRKIILDSSEDEFPSPRPTKRKKKRRVLASSDDDDLSSDNDSDGSPKKNRSQRMLTRDELEKDTVDAEEAEKERRKRLIERQKEFNGIQYETVVTEDGTAITTKLKNLILDNDAKNKEPVPVQVHEKLVNILKSHQAEGIQFMYDCAFESLEQFRNGISGGGGILAHCMGLGKTLQVIAFIHTILKHKEISKKVSKVLVVVPKNVVLNWQNEFEKWLPKNRDFDVYELDSFKEHRDRLRYLRAWKEQRNPAVMIIGYDMFRILTQSDEDRVLKGRAKKVPKKPKKISGKQKAFFKLQPEFRRLLQNPGPDLVVCDEAHKLKNDESLLARTMLKIKTKRRICLTGTPLQNNLNEYFVMVSFVKPHLLGTKTEFKNQFGNIIERGRTKDASNFEVILMRKRCFVLFERLNKIVQRKDISVLQQSIPGKLEYVINVRLTEPQVQLYDTFLTMVDRAGGAELRKRLLSDYHIFSRIWTHPYQLIYHVQELQRKNLLKGDLDGFVVDDDDEEEESESNSDDLDSVDSGDSDLDDNAALRKGTRHSKRVAKDDSGSVSPLPFSDPPSPTDDIPGWWSDVVTIADKFNLEMSNKLVILFDIIKRCEAIGDKLLVFSQSLESLRLIRNFLEEYDRTNGWFVDGHECLAAKGEKWGWKQGYDFLQIDGSVSSHDREHIQTQFNKKTNLRARLMLISTRAGSLGTNMVAANRVVIFDSCWNPSHDTQSLFRVYRIGQVKPVYIYRLIAQGTMEECIYKRQVTKDSTSLRCIDEKQIQRHFLSRDLEELYTLSFIAYNENAAPLNTPPRDRLLAELILKNAAAVVNYIFHDNLFENVDGEKLTPEEREQAWQEYNTAKANPHASMLQSAAAAAAENAALQSVASSTLAAILNTTPRHVVNGVFVEPTLASLIEEDNIYRLCSMNGFNPMQCTHVAYIKIISHILLQKLPRVFSGGVFEIASNIAGIVTEKGLARDKTADVLKLFQGLQTSFRRDPETAAMLDHYERSSPWLRPVSITVLPRNFSSGI